MQPPRPATGLADDLVSSAVLEFIAGLGELPSGGAVPNDVIRMLLDGVTNATDDQKVVETWCAGGPRSSTGRAP